MRIGIKTTMSCGQTFPFLETHHGLRVIPVLPAVTPTHSHRYPLPHLRLGHVVAGVVPRSISEKKR